MIITQISTVFLPQVVVAVLLDNFLVATEAEKSRQQATVRRERVRALLLCNTKAGMGLVLAKGMLNYEQLYY